MRAALVALLLSGSACSAKPATTATPTTPAPTTNIAADTGPLTEAQFKALHELPPDAPVALTGEMMNLPDGTLAYLSLPPGPGPHPGILVIHEWWGLNDHIKHWADRLASAGWAALAVDLYGGKVAHDRDAAMAAMKAVEPAAALNTLHEALDTLKFDRRVKAPVQAAIGWCFGGGYTLQAAQTLPELDGAIMFYGHFDPDPAKLKPIKARLLGIFGDRDQGIPTAEVVKLDAALKEAGVSAEILRYDAEHGFANPSNPKYDAVHAAAAWQRVLTFLDGLRVD